MKIAITGATGFVGRELCHHLREAGHIVVPIVRRTIGLPNEVVAGPLEGANPAMLANGLREVDAVAHLAALTHIREDCRQAFHQVNVDGTRRLLDAIDAAGVGRVVYMSSIKVNGEETQPGERFCGTDIPAPEDEYGRTKHEAERLIATAVRAAARHAVILRPPMVYGSGVAGNFGRLVAAVRRGVPLPFGGVDNRRSLISVRNLVDATAIALTRSDAGGSVLTLCDGEDVSTPDLIEAIGQAVGRRPRLIPLPTGILKFAGRLTGHSDDVRRMIGNLQVDNEAARIALNWAPRDQLCPALRRMLVPNG